MTTSRRELLIFALASTLILAWSSLPTWAGTLAQNEESVFGGTYFDRQDYAAHITMLRMGMRGAWGYQLRFTSESNPPVYIRVFYVWLGEIDRLVGAAPAVAYQFARWVFGYAALWSIFRLANYVFDGDRGAHWTAFFLAVFGSGLGWLQRSIGWLPGPITPVDFWLIDAYVLFSLSLFPHFAFTLALMSLALVLYLKYLGDGDWRRIPLIILSALLAQLVNPIAFVVVDAAFALATLGVFLRPGSTKRKHSRALGVIAIAQIPLLLYDLSILARDPIWSKFTFQNQTLSPPAIYYLWGFGLFWPYALLGGIRAVRKSDWALLGMLGWVIVAFALAYSPMAIQRRFLFGITIPLGMLATRGLMDLGAWARQRFSWLGTRALALRLLAALSISATTFVLIPAYALYMLQRPDRYFYPRTLEPALNWVRLHTGPDDLVLSAERTGQLVAQEAGRRVFLGHEAETLNYRVKTAEVLSFYNGEMGADWLTRAGIRWIVYGPYERAVQPHFEPGPDLELEFDVEGTQIYGPR